jgi:toxin ParE1/3/4
MGTPREYGGIKGLRMSRVRGFEGPLVFYRPLAGGIEIIRVLHASRDLEALFKGG